MSARSRRLSKTDIKSWLEQTGFPVNECRFLNPPAPPYVVFWETQEVYGSDDKNLLRRSHVRIELYTAAISRLCKKKITDLLDAGGYEYQFDRDWIENKKLFVMFFEFSFLEKTDGGNE